jgi:uncharacterized membrane protein YhaH (DUF805 family)
MQVIKRLIILLLILGVNIGLCLLVGLEITSETWDKNLSLTTIAAFVIMVPIDIRRLNDIGISPWWLVPVWFLSQIPEPLDGSPQVGAYTLLVIIPLFLWGLFILFKPGKTLREARRQME